MLGFTGTFEGQPISVQSTGMGCPSAAIVAEELSQLGVKRIVRVGTCGGLGPGLALGDVICAVSAVPADHTTCSTPVANRTRRPPTSRSSTPPCTRRSAPG